MQIENDFKKAVDLYEIGKISDAKKICIIIYEKNPKNFDNLRLLNYIYFKEKNFSKALYFINKAIKINSNFAEAYIEQGNALNELKKYEEAINSFNKAIKINPNNTRAYHNKGFVLHELGNIKLAIESYNEAIKTDPNFVQSHNNLGFAFHQLKKFSESLKSYKKAFEINPNFNFLLGKIIHSKRYFCEWNSHEKNLITLKNKLKKNETASLPFAILSLYDSPLLQQKAAEIFIKETFLKKKNPNNISNIKKNEKIRIGYYSADFYNHAMAFLLARMFELHDKSKFEIIAFYFGPKKNDLMNKRIRNAFTQFIEVNSKTDKEISELSKELNIDIAIDLMCYTTNARIGIFSERCAPIQINYLGYPGTSGADFIDYIIADKILIPKENQQFYSEKIIYLPNTYQVRDPTQRISNKIYKRKDFGLPEKNFVFCCFNQNYKITPDVYDIWMRLLKKIDGSVLWLLKNSNEGANNLKKESQKRGVDPNRIIFAEKLSQPDHLARHKLADLFIDTFPYSAHTTCSDALWSGLPIITRMGESFASRVGGSILSAIGLKELITKTEKEYEDLAINLASNSKVLKNIKKKLIKNKTNKPLFDTKLYTSNIESAYIKVYENYHLKLNKKNIEIK